MGFKVGDKVYELNRIGTVIKISPKRMDITVDFGRNIEVYNKFGLLKGADPWYPKRINILTPEKEQEIKDRMMVNLCKAKFQKVMINADQAERIIKILDEGIMLDKRGE